MLEKINKNGKKTYREGTVQRIAAASFERRERECLLGRKRKG
jgi:hypothetical protein